MVRVGARLIRLPVWLFAALTVLGASSASLSSAGTVDAAVLRVSTTADEMIRHDGTCSLREAIAAVDSPGRRSDCGTAGRGSNTIVLGRGRYLLSIGPTGPDGNASGDLNLTAHELVTITGAGPRLTTIDATRAHDRVLTVGRGARLTLARLTITGGQAPAAPPHLAGSPDIVCRAAGTRATPVAAGLAGDGGGVYNAGTLLLNDVDVVGNRAGAGGSGWSGGGPCGPGPGGQGGSGGGVYSLGTLTLSDSTIDDNRAGAGGSGGGAASTPGQAFGPGGAGGPGGGGGAIYSTGKLTVTTSTIAGNRAGVGGAGGQGGGGGGPPGSGGAGGSGGGIFSSAGRSRLVNDTLFGNTAGAGGAPGGHSGSGGAVAVVQGSSLVRNDTVANNGPGGGLFVASALRADDMILQNSIVASSAGAGCVATPRSAITNAGHDLSYGDGTCPGRRANPRLGPLRNYGGPTKTMALLTGSAAIGRIPPRHGDCPGADQRGVARPQGKGCDIGAYEFAVPKITIFAPFHGASYQRGARIRARFRCGEGGVAGTIAVCRGSVTAGHWIRTDGSGRVRFTVTAIDRSGNRVRKTIRYTVWEYVDPLRSVSGLTPRRIDLGVDYAGSGPLLAIGLGRVTTASDTDTGPQSCWAISCWPGGGIVVYRLLEGPFAGKYVYVAEHLTVNVRVGQTVRPGQQIATLYAGYPWSEWGWAAGPGPEALAMADGHRCTCSDPGGWSTIEGRNMDDLLVRLGAPSGYLQSVPNQSMPPGWPTWPARARGR